MLRTDYEFSENIMAMVRHIIQNSQPKQGISWHKGLPNTSMSYEMDDYRLTLSKEWLVIQYHIGAFHNIKLELRDSGWCQIDIYTPDHDITTHYVDSRGCHIYRLLPLDVREKIEEIEGQIHLFLMDLQKSHKQYLKIPHIAYNPKIEEL